MIAHENTNIAEAGNPEVNEVGTISEVAVKIESSLAEVNIISTRILVVDDEFGQFVYAQLRESEPDIEAMLGDPDCPEIEELLKLCESGMDVTAFQNNYKAFNAFLTSDAFVQNILLSDAFCSNASQNLIGKFSNFFTRTDRGRALRREFDLAFPSAEYEIDFVATRPPAADAIT